jgi:CheY-like chemotaxis protein
MPGKGAPTDDKRGVGGDRRTTRRGGRRAIDQSHSQEDIARVRASMSPGPAPLVLVVDDFNDGREMAVEYFKFLGFRVAEARTANEALEKAGSLLPDAILLDLVLPEMDGIEVVKRLRSSERTKHLPIVICTAAVMTDSRTRAAKAFADMFVPKPYDLSTLALQVVYLVGKHRPAAVPK